MKVFPQINLPAVSRLRAFAGSLPTALPLDHGREAIKIQEKKIYLFVKQSEFTFAS